MSRPFILLTNDDGIRSPGLAAAAAELDDLGELLIVAPREQQTSMSRSRSQQYGADGRIEMVDVIHKEKTWPGYAANASPALTVEHAIIEVAHRPIDLVVSGINYGENVGSCVTVSGTIGAALEAADCGIPALAVSLETFGSDYHTYNYEVDFNTAAYFTKIVAEKMLSSALPDDVDVLKLEVPASATKDTKTVIARQDKIAYYTVEMEKRLDITSAGEFKHAALKGQYSQNDTDAYALAQGLVCITPLSLDLTSRVPLEKLGEILEFDNLFNNGE